MQYQPFQSLPTRRFKSGDLIFTEGDEGDFAYILEDGKVEIWTMIQGERLVLNVIERGTLFGELALVDRQPRSASASALNDCTLAVVTKEQVNQRVQEADPILRMLLLVVMRYFRSETSHFRGGKPESSKEAEATETLYPEVTLQNDLSNRITDAVDLIRMEAELREALTQQQFHLVYQPIINLAAHRIDGFEALIRWQSPTRGFVRPDAFIALAEATSLIIPIGQWVLKQGLEDLRLLEKNSPFPLCMSFNIASRQIDVPDFIPWLLNAAQDAGVKPSQIKLEILERTLFDRERALAWVQACRAEGIKLALDDFGTGYSSLQYLNEYNLDNVKIDKSFVQGLENNLNSQSICRAVVNLSSALSMTVVAEGVETEAQLNNLREIGCTYGQGYFFAKPLPLERAITWCQDFNRVLQTR